MARPSSCSAHVAYNATQLGPLLDDIVPSAVRALEGKCRRPLMAFATAAGIAAPVGGGVCADLGVGGDDRWRQLAYLPDAVPWRKPAAAEPLRAALQLQTELTRLQHVDGCGSRPLHSPAKPLEQRPRRLPRARRPLGPPDL